MMGMERSNCTVHPRALLNAGHGVVGVGGRVRGVAREGVKVT